MLDPPRLPSPPLTRFRSGSTPVFWAWGVFKVDIYVTIRANNSLASMWGSTAKIVSSLALSKGHCICNNTVPDFTTNFVSQTIASFAYSRLIRTISRGQIEMSALHIEEPAEDRLRIEVRHAQPID